MKIYNVITTSVCEGGAVEVSVRSTTDETKANEIFAEEKSKLEECFDEETDDILADEDDLYGHYDMDDPAYNNCSVRLVAVESE